MAESNDGRTPGMRNSGGVKREVQYFDSDFSFQEHAADCSAKWEKSPSGGGSDGDGDGDGSSSALKEDDDELLPQSQSKCWDAFHTHHSAGNFYKPRRYLINAFPCIMEYFQHGSVGTTGGCDGNGGNEELQSTNEDRILLEIGCGSGSSCIPILKHCSEMESFGDDVKSVLLACDSSPVAVETTKRFIEKMDAKAKERSDPKPCNEISFGTFVADPSLTQDEAEESFLQEAKAAYEDVTSSGSDNNGTDGIAGIVLMVFVLSAVTPSRVARFLEQMYETTSPGGKVCFRDYGMYDMPMLRFDPSAACESTTSNDPVFVRGEGTIARFFSIETTKELFESAGFTMVELRYCTVFNSNRKTGQKLKRVFVHGVFQKPTT